MLVMDGWTWIVDLKTTGTIEPWSFGRRVSDMDYFMQLAWYRRGLNILAPVQRLVGILAVENTPPHEVVCYRPNEQDMLQAEQEVLECAARWKACAAEDKWPGIADDQWEILRYPAYRRPKEEQ